MFLQRMTSRLFLSKLNHISNKCLTTGSVLNRLHDANPHIIRSPTAEKPIELLSIRDLIFDNLGKRGDRVSLVNGFTGQRFTSAEVQKKVHRIASALVRKGLGKGDIVTLLLPSSPEFAISLLAITCIGATISPLNPLYTTDELVHPLRQTNAKALITIPDLAPIAHAASKLCPHLKHIITTGSAEGCQSLLDLADDDGTLFPDNLDLDLYNDLAFLPYSSGTTGKPKGVMLSHFNITSNLNQMDNDQIGYVNEDTTFVAVLPFFHIYGLVVSTLRALVGGGKLVALPKFEPQKFLENVHLHRPLQQHLVPPLMLFLAQHPLVDKFDLSGTEDIIVAAAPTSAEVVHQVQERLKLPNLTVRQGYGLTETSPVTHACPAGEFNVKSIGPPLPHLNAKIVDVTSRSTLGPGEEGELMVAGPNVMLGYYKNPEATSNTITEDGWLYTGDIGYYDENGFFYITDRLKELIKVKGLQVAPAELEGILIGHPGIKDAAVIGIPDERSGELPRAYVVKIDDSLSQQDVAAFVQNKVAKFKELTGGVEFVEEIPKAASGKILRRLLKTKFLEGS